VEVNNSQANTNQQNQRALVIGQITSSGVITPNTPQISQGVGYAILQGGNGSMLALMTNAFQANVGFGEVWYLPLADAEGAVPAAGSINFTAVPTAVGVMSLYIAGQLVSYTVTAGETVDELGTGLVAAINAIGSMPVIAAVSGTTPSEVTLTAKNAGMARNDIDIRVNYQGAANGEVTPAGLSFTIVAMASGATNPTSTTGLANLLDMPFDFIVCPYTDVTSLTALQDFLDDTTGR